MKIGTAFPRILNKQYPVVKPDYPLLVVLYLLRMREVDAVPLYSDGKDEARAVFGFSCLPHFMSLGPKKFAKLLSGPCERVADELVSLGVDQGLESLFEAFASKRLGFALAHGVRASSHKRSLITLSDVLDLYARGVIGSDLLAREVSTPTFSMPGDTSIRDALKAMFKRRYRRVFVNDRECISDRSIIDYLFSPLLLEDLGAWKGDIFTTPIQRLKRTRPTVVPPYTSLRTAALKLRGDRGGCLVVGTGKVATPWDVVMKPWFVHRMNVRGLH